MQLPVEHWKIVAYRVNGILRFKAFLLTQNLDGLEKSAPDFLDDFDTYLVSLDTLQTRTGLRFDDLRVGATQIDLLPVAPMIVTDPTQVPW